jgi:hypothetical protein
MASLVAGGFFTGRYTSLEDAPEEGSRFDPNKKQGQVIDLLCLLSSFV